MRTVARMKAVVPGSVVPGAVVPGSVVPGAVVTVPVMPVPMVPLMPVPVMPWSGLRYRDVMRNGLAYDSAGTAEKVDDPQYQEDHRDYSDEIHFGLFCHL